MKGSNGAPEIAGVSNTAIQKWILKEWMAMVNTLSALCVQELFAPYRGASQSTGVGTRVESLRGRMSPFEARESMW